MCPAGCEPTLYLPSHPAQIYVMASDLPQAESIQGKVADGSSLDGAKVKSSVVQLYTATRIGLTSQQVETQQ